MSDTQTRYAIRTTDASGAVKYYNGSFYFGTDGSLLNAQMFTACGNAVSVIKAWLAYTDREQRRPGDTFWMAALDMWSRAEVVMIEVSFKVVS